MAELGSTVCIRPSSRLLPCPVCTDIPLHTAMQEIEPPHCHVHTLVCSCSPPRTLRIRMPPGYTEREYTEGATSVWNALTTAYPRT